MRNIQWLNKRRIWNHRRTNKGNLQQKIHHGAAGRKTTASSNQFYLRETSPFILMQRQITNMHLVRRLFSLVCLSDFIENQDHPSDLICPLSGALYIHEIVKTVALNQSEKCCFLKQTTNDGSYKSFSLIANFYPNGVCFSLPVAIYENKVDLKHKIS